MHRSNFRINTALDVVDAALRRDKRWIVALFAFAFVLKLVFILQSLGSLQMRVPILDARFYDETARDIAAGHIIRGEAFFMGPLYPYFMAIVYGVFGSSLLAKGLVQIAGGSLTVVLTFLIGSRVFRPSVGMLGALMLALYGTATFYEGQMLMMWLGTLLNMLMLFVLLREPAGKRGEPAPPRESGKRGGGPARLRGSCKDGITPAPRRDALRFALAGALLGLSALARVNILIFLPVILVWILFVDIDGKGRRFIRAAALVAGAFAAILPATVHNYAVSRDFVLITSNGGVNFYVGNNAEATGTYDPPMGINMQADPTTRRYVERALGRELKPSAISRYWMDRSLAFIREHPGREAALLVRKASIFINGFEWPQIESYDLSKGRYGIFRILFVNFHMIVSLGLVGMIFGFRLWRRHFLLHWFVTAYSLSIIFFFVTDRYRIQIVPVLSLFAAYALLEIFPRVSARSPRAWFAPALFVLLLFMTRPGLFAIDGRHLVSREHIHEAWRWSAIGESGRALEEMSRAVQIRPGDPEPYIHRAAINRDSGRLPQAVDDYNSAIAIDPGNPSVRYNLAQVLQDAGDYTAAVREYRKAIDLDPHMIEAYNNLGVAYRMMKDYENAVRSFTKVIEIDPRHIKAYNNLGAALAEGGDTDAAIQYFREAIRRDPAYPHSYKNLAMAYIEQNRLADAAASLEKCLELAPGDAAASAILGEVRNAIEARRRSD
ncbi:MAG: tetratricopeptide repeat protein [Candidatus Krumholzibacteria bacterium]|nr:tetratricopeptide repeat protein [Candidatus Krumholzibacteria bacterium]